ncbi:FAD-dependent oxidoreductase [Streptomyces sp. NBC_00243]|uniref:FAD-dependent oxidoreductase n=1 Tax=Streptomyces sp. NBC_00243 TaxID=2975688 RepID=UPI002DDB3801|nr:FAD-dependent monooxygenase [Streptomyces sp. NBC_00243]WRZ25498.1 FAD-dependent oxidoreductase [Streptomyces sp. NBC_00243]
MARILVLGAGLCGLSTALLLARDGHQVTVLERDPAEPPQAAQLWEAWQRPGVNQFLLPHLMLPRWRAEMDRELPEVLHELEAVGGLRINLLAMLPPHQRGPWRDGDDAFETVTARRPVLEAALTTVAAGTAGVTIRRGVAVTGLLTDTYSRAPVPRVTGVLADGDHTLQADLVVDCGGRRSALASWLQAVGGRRPAEDRADCGFVYYGRTFRTRNAALPECHTSVLQRHESMSILTLPADNGTWSVVLVASSRDPAMRALRHPARWDAALALYPLAAHWRDGEPISGIAVMAGIEDRHRDFVVDGDPVATGVVAVGDSWACTNPSLGRGSTIGLLHASGLRDVLRETGPDEHDKLVRRFHDWTTTAVQPLHRSTLWYDQHRLAELDADAAGVPYQADDPKWAFNLATFAASRTDPDIARAYQSLASLLATPDELFAEPGLPEKITKLGGHTPNYPLPGPRRCELLAAIDT